MEKQNSKFSAIYFHMGPGFHAKIEAQQFQEAYPHILFADQPRGVNFSGLVDWAEDLIRLQFQVNHQPLTLLGHSFGAQVIAQVLPRVPECVKEIRLLNSPFDSFDCFANLDRTLNPQTAHDRAFWKKKTPDEKMALIFSLAQNPGLSEAYWLSNIEQKSYEQLAALHPPMDIETFIAVYSEYLATPQPSYHLQWQGPVRIYYSTQDRLIQDVETITAWRDLFPQAELIELSAVGHYALFESPDLAKIFLQN